MNHLAVRDLHVWVRRRPADFEAVAGIDLDLAQGSSLALVGESGSGKTVTALAIAGLLAENLHATGSVRLADTELLSLNPRERRAMAGSKIGFVFQEPMSALHPVLPIGTQVGEGLRAHTDLSKQAREERVLDLLDMVGLSRNRDIASQRIGQLSGGMRQRVMIAMALSCEPTLLIADEPTTALDVTLQRQVIDLVISLQERMGLSLLMITHDLGVVRDTCENVAVMYCGQIVERGRTATLFADPRHEYTHALIAANPRLDETRDRLPSVPADASWLHDLRNASAAEQRNSEMTEVGAGHWVRTWNGAAR